MARNNKVLNIQNCYFRLPQDFEGTCGDALMLLALQRLEREQQQTTTNETNNDNSIRDFWNSDRKCIMSYCISTEEVFRKVEEK